MEHNRKHKLLMIIALVLGIASLSVGFAAFSVSLKISSSASVSPNVDTFSVKFSMSKSSLDVGPVEPTAYSNGVTPTNGVIYNSTNPTITNLSATFTEPGQFVEYTFYARNEGEYTAFLNNINFNGEKVCIAETGTTDSLVQSACDSIKISVNIRNNLYSDTTPITGYSLAQGEGEAVYIGIEYLASGTQADGTFSIKLPDIALVYSTVDNSSIQPTLSESIIKLDSGDLKTVGSIVSIGNEQFYIIGHDNNNIKLLTMYNLYVGGEYKKGTWTAYGNEATGIQDADMLGYVAGHSTRKGVTAYSSESQKGVKYSDYAGSIVELYINIYANYLENIGVEVSKARLIANDELISLGCSYDDSTCGDAYEFVYSTTYWSGYVWDDENVGIVSTDKNYGYYPVIASKLVGVRPVIEIPVSEF